MLKSICFVLGSSATFRQMFIMLKSPEGEILTYGIGTAVTRLQKFMVEIPEGGGFLGASEIATLLKDFN
ncbi:MAG TPA: hypothetical protein VIU33_01400 [Nitrospiria bacterium]